MHIGRITRLKFWLAVLVFLLLGTFSGKFPFAVILAFICITYASIGRFHDLNNSGFCLLGMMVPIVNLVIAFHLLFLRGTLGPNEYGVDPLCPDYVDTPVAKEKETDKVKSDEVDYRRNRLKYALERRRLYEEWLNQLERKGNGD